MEEVALVRYVQINSVPNGSTGSVMRRVESERLAAGDESWRMWGRGRAPENDHEFNYGTRARVCLDALRTRLDGRAGFHSRAATRRLLEKLDDIRPDVVHLHNLHGYHVHVGMLFDWLAAHDCRVKWTLHDCWAFTGHCAYFTYVGCDRWRDGSCGEGCPQLGTYPKTVSRSGCARSFEDKRCVFNTLPSDRMTLITPSRWLAGLVEESFLSKYPVEVRHNTIDTAVFRPTPGDFRERHGVGDRFTVLGVASPWTERKGLPDFLRLADDLDGHYAVVLVGLSKRQIKSMPASGPKGCRVVALPRTSNSAELAEVYTAADVFFNPTREDNYPTVNLEAEACGTPVVTYNVGGCSETVGRADSCVVTGYDEALLGIRRDMAERLGGVADEYR